MSSFQEILDKSYLSFAQLEHDAQATAAKDGFVLIRSSFGYITGVVSKGTFRCYKSGTSKAQPKGTSKVKPKGTSKTDCKFQVNFRRQMATGIYYFTDKHHLSHNHPMDPACTVMSAMVRRFTTSQANLISSMRSKNVPVALIIEELRKSTNAVIQKQDIYNSLQQSEREYINGRVQVLDLLSALDGNADFVYRVGTVGENQLKWLTFADRNSLAQFSSMNFVLLMDATYKTNRFNMPLLLISSINPFGRSYVVAACLLSDETTISYNQALMSFKELFGSSEPLPFTIITDQETALINAIDTQFPRSSHQLCRWHLAKNLEKNFGVDAFILSQFADLMWSNSEEKAYQIYCNVREKCSDKEATHLDRLYGLREKYVEAWVSRYRNLEMRTTQRAESTNNAFKQLLGANAKLVDLFHAIKQMNKSNQEACAFLKFQMRDKHRAYPQVLSSIAGQVSTFVFDLVEHEYDKKRLLIVDKEDDEDVSFIDTFKVTGARSCNCPFYLQYSAPCAHLWMIAGEAAVNLFHPAWRIGNETVTQPAILYGPRQAPQASPEEIKRAEFAALSSDLRARLLDMDIDMGIAFYKVFHGMLDRGSMHAPAAIQDPPILKSRGRPAKKKKNIFRGNSIS
jgi:hypothetical protein